MSRFSSILNLILRILGVVTLIAVTLVSISTAYILYAPDSLPKPFYLSYHYATPASQAAAVTPMPTSTPTPLPPVDVKPGEGIMVNSGSKIINIADPTGKKYIRVTVVLEFAPMDPTYLKMTAEQKTAYVTTFTSDITTKLPLVDDSVITLLSTKTFDALYTADGKETLRKEIIDRVNARLPDYKVIQVYFTEFVVD